MLGHFPCNKCNNAPYSFIYAILRGKIVLQKIALTMDTLLGGGVDGIFIYPRTLTQGIAYALTNASVQ